ncbi:MAG: GAF domain-containing protein [Proteobacteria bacterium]|nr:GAF domain-containing protein [Pseudomonadota bacterium]
MNNIALYGSSERLISLYEKMKEDKNINVSLVIDEMGVLQKKKVIPDNIIKSNLSELTEGKNSIFAIINVDNNPELKDRLTNLGLGHIKIISGSSAEFLYRGAEGLSEKKDISFVVGELKGIADNLSMLFDKEKLLDEILKFLCDKTGANRGSIMLYDKKEKVLKVAMSYGIDRVLWDFIKIPVGEGIAGKVVENKEPIIITGSPDDKSFKKIRKREDIKSAICVPLLKDDEVVGVINLSSNSDINAFSEKDLEFLKSVSAIIGDILFTSKSFAEFREDSERYKSFSELSQILSQKIPLYDRIKKIIDFIFKSFSVYSLIALRSKEFSFEIVATNYSILDSNEIFSEDTLERWVFDSKESVFFAEPERKNFRGYAVFPLIDENECFGIISFINFKRDGYVTIDFLKDLSNDLSRLLSLVYHKEEVAEQTRLRDFTDEIFSELSLMDDRISFFNHLLKRLSECIGSSVSFLRIYDEEKKAYTVKDCIGYENIVNKDFFELDRELVKRAIKTKKELLIKNTKRDIDLAYLYPQISSFIIYPCLVGKEVEACFSFYNKKGAGKISNFSLQDIKLIDDIISKIIPLYRELERKSVANYENYIDIVTGLPNFRYYEKRVFEEIARAKRHNKRVVLLIIELQNYEKYLESYGKKFTDEIIKKIAFELREKIRSFEVVSRLNDNKFGIILVDADEKALEVVFRLKKVFEKMNFDPKNLLKEEVSIRFGYSRFPDDGDEYDELIVKANHIRG